MRAWLAVLVLSGCGPAEVEQPEPREEAAQPLVERQPVSVSLWYRVVDYERCTLTTCEPSTVVYLDDVPRLTAHYPDCHVTAAPGHITIDCRGMCTGQLAHCYSRTVCEPVPHVEAGCRWSPPRD